LGNRIPYLLVCLWRCRIYISICRALIASGFIRPCRIHSPFDDYACVSLCTLRFSLPFICFLCFLSVCQAHNSKCLSLSLRCRADNDAKSVAFGGGSISDPGKPNTSHVKQAGITYRKMNFIEWVGWECLEEKSLGAGESEQSQRNLFQ